MSDETQQSIELLHPMSEDHSVLRRTLLSSLIDVVKYNQARKITDNAFFEIGKKYYQVGEQTYEETLLSGIINGNIPNTLWKSQSEKVDFYYLKGILDVLFRKLRVNVEYLTLEKAVDELHPKRSAQIMYNGKLIGFIGEIHPKYAKDNDLVESYVFELSLDLLTDTKPEVEHFKVVSKVPSVERDLALVMDVKQSIGEVLEAIRKSDKMISNVKIFDLYIGDKIPENKKSVAVRITIESEETLTDEVIASKIKRILKSLEYRYNIVLRA